MINLVVFCLAQLVSRPADAFGAKFKSIRSVENFEFPGEKVARLASAKGKQSQHLFAFPAQS